MTIRGATPDPHRVADGGVADTGLGPETHADSIPAALSTGPFTVQWLSDGWFVGLPGAAQRVEDPTGLDSWLAANGQMDRTSPRIQGNSKQEKQI